MRAAQIDGFGGPDVITVRDGAPRPTPASGELLVAVRAASLNPIDTLVREGRMQQAMPLTFPATLGGDFAGVVTAAGRGGGVFPPGEEVYGQALAPWRGSGTLAEYAVVGAGTTARKPKTVDLVAASSLPLVGASALQAITEHLEMRRGQRLLIHGAAGGIGAIAVQIAAHLGAYVIATAIGDDVDFVKGLGADEVIDARAQPFESVVREVDGVLDTVGGDVAARSYAVLKRGGVLVSMTAPPDEARMKERGVTAIAQLTEPSTQRLTTLAALVDVGVVTPNVARVFPLEQAAAAFTFRETKHPRGKVVVTI